MSRYFIMRKKPKAGWIEDEDVWPAEVARHIPSVDDHVATDTGLLDMDGNCIMRAPNPIGFIWDHGE